MKIDLQLIALHNAPRKDGKQPWTIELETYRLVFTGHLANAVTRQMLAKFTDGRLGSLPAIAKGMKGEEEKQDTVQIAKKDVDYSCGECREGEWPQGTGSIARLVNRKTWVGCGKRENCKSPSYFFHVKCSDMELGKLRKNRFWICKLCRKDWNRALEGGKLHDGMYAYIHRTHRGTYQGLDYNGKREDVEEK